MRSRLSALATSLLTLFAIASAPRCVSAFYLPGVAPTDYQEGDPVKLNVNTLVPRQSENDASLHRIVGYDYYHPGFHFCQPQDGVKDVGPESLGAIIFGDRIKNSPFEMHMLRNTTGCQRLCDETTFETRAAKFTNARIRESYYINWLVDGLPAGQAFQIPETGEQFLRRGFPLGVAEPDGTPVLHNHFDIMIEYHAISGGKYRVVGVQVYSHSKANSGSSDETSVDCGPDSALVLNEEGDTPVTWTYSVTWTPSDVAWAVRWDMYLRVEDPKIHWFSLINSAIIVVFLVGTVSAILMRALKKDFQRYNRLDTFNLDDFSTNDITEDGIQEDSGWKLVHGDVFRPPPSPLLLSVFLGNGAQLFFMTGLTILFALFGFLSPSNRGSLGTAILILYTLLGFVGGYVSARAYKTFGGDAWKRNIILTPTFVPAIVFATFFLMNLVVWGYGSSGAVPFTTMLVLVAIWFVITLPLSFVGSWLGFKQKPIQAPVRTNQIPRQIPPAISYLRPLPSLLLVGALPFGAIFVELFFIMNSIWFSKIYYMFGFMFLCFGLMIITCAAVTIMFVYYLLCAENHRWQWRAFNSAGAGSIFVFTFALVYWVWRLRFTGLGSFILYLGYSALISFFFFILTGAIGFLASWAFVHRIYRSIRID